MLAAVAGIAVAFLYGGLREQGSAAFLMAFGIGLIAAATSLAVSLLLFYLLMPRLKPGMAAFAALALGALAAFAIGALLQPVNLPV